LPLVAPLVFAPQTRRDWTRGDAGELARIAQAEARWRGWIRRAWPAFDEVGAKRTRGFGQLSWAGELT